MRSGRQLSTVPQLGSGRVGWPWVGLAIVELGLVAVSVLEDLFLPTLIILAIAGLSLAVRRERPSTLGLVRPQALGRTAVVVLAWTLAWTVVQLAVVIPVLEHLTGQHQALGPFEELQGNVGLLVLLLVLSWTLAAFGEEFGYRGFVQARIADLVGSGRAGVLAAVLVSSALFAIAHTEQGAVGVGATFFDALFFSVVMRRSGNAVWAAILAHGFNNTLGLVAYFLVGPVYGLW
jgi:CAAX protease family protein